MPEVPFLLLGVLLHLAVIALRLFAACWVIRLAVRHGSLDARRRWVEQERQVELRLDAEGYPQQQAPPTAWRLPGRPPHERPPGRDPRSRAHLERDVLRAARRATREPASTTTPPTAMTTVAARDTAL
ncbi:hypothetical protein GCM10009756_10670 [Pseudokineococcus marinus]